MNAAPLSMNNDTITSPFPATRQDLSDLKSSAVDAARELTATATFHAQEAKGQLKNLASHAKKESREELDQAKLKLADLGEKMRDYLAARPLATIGTALAVGFFIGLSRRGSSRGA
jgi:ElaB/YqjD/DUF883 family membrane-anchored ribosome-binding protein